MSDLQQQSDVRRPLLHSNHNLVNPQHAHQDATFRRNKAAALYAGCTSALPGSDQMLAHQHNSKPGLQLVLMCSTCGAV